MKIERMRLRGWIGLKKGMDIEDLTLDLSRLSGLVALSGKNGAGKSSCLELMSPYRTLASRKGALKKHVFLRDSLRELSFRWNGDLYETLVKIDAQSDRGEAFIYKNGVPEIKGKSSEYDRYMVDLLGSPELFFASVFCAQNSEKLSDMRPGELKGLFSEFLRLHLYEQYEEDAKARRNTLTTQADALENERKYLEEEAGKKADLQTSLDLKHLDLLDRIGKFEKTKSHIQECEAGLKALRKRVEDNRLHEALLKDLQATGRKLAEDWAKEKAAGEKGINDLRAKLKEAEGGITANNYILEKRGEIEKASTRESEINQELQKSNEALAACSAQIRNVMDRLAAFQKQKTDIQRDLQALKTDDQAAKLRNTVASLKEKKTLLDKKDPACTSRTCAFIVSALKAEELPVIEKALADREAYLFDKQLSRTGEITTLDGQIKEALQKKAGRERYLSTITETIARLKAELKSVSALSAMKSQLDTATAKLEGLNTRQADLFTEIETAQRDFVVRKSTTEISIAENAAAIQEAQQQIDIMAATDLEQEEQSLKGLIAAKESTEKEIASLRADLSALEAQIRDLEGKERRLVEIQEKRAVIIREAGQWEYLKDACSAKGLRALEIDSVAPTISAYANDLLSRTFGPLFQVRFRTQNDEGKEVLDILTIREDGTETLIENLSGGERVWNLKALRLAMTLVSKEKSGRAFGTCFADEEDGALDVENGQNFIQLYRSFLAAGGFDSMYFISHKPESIGMADHVIHFNHGIEIE